MEEAEVGRFSMEFRDESEAHVAHFHHMSHNPSLADELILGIARVPRACKTALLD